MIIFRRRADWTIYKEEDGEKKIPQGVIELSTSGKIREKGINSATLNSCVK
jgi:hypothetical protein